MKGAREVFRSHFREMESGEGTPWAERCDTYMYLAQMRIAGWDIGYASLNAIAGYATSFAYAPRPDDRWMAHYFPIAGRDDRIAHATGFRCRWRQYKEPQEYWQALREAIDAGRAVHAPNEEDVLFIGYEDAGIPEDRKVMPLAIVFVDEDAWSWDRFLSWHSREMVDGWFGCMEERVQPWPPEESAIEVMDVMLRVGRGDDPRRIPGDGVVWGVAGIEAYADDLADLSKSGADEEMGGFFQSGWRGCHNIMPQMSGRPAATTYLKRVAEHFEGQAGEGILAAAAGYDSATEAWRSYDHHLGRSLKGIAHDRAWQDGERRKAGADAVREAAAREREALKELEGALTALGRPA